MNPARAVRQRAARREPAGDASTGGLTPRRSPRFALPMLDILAEIRLGGNPGADHNGCVY